MAADAAGLTAEASSTSVPLVSMIRRTMSRAARHGGAQHPQLGGQQAELLHRLRRVGQVARVGQRVVVERRDLGRSIPSAISRRLGDRARGRAGGRGDPRSRARWLSRCRSRGPMA